MSDAGAVRRPNRLHWILWLLLGLALGAQAVRLRIAEAAVSNRNGLVASQVRPQNGMGRALNAERYWQAGNAERAAEESLAALRHTLLAVIAVRTLALARDKMSGPGAGEPAWQAAALMGWRDKQTQLWGVLRALANGEPEILAMRADALLRTGDRDGQLSVMIRGFLSEPRVRAAFVERLALDPRWRWHFLTNSLGERSDELDGLVATLRDLGRTRSPPTRHEVHRGVEGLIERRRFAEAASLHAMVAGRPPALPMDDGGFERPDKFYRLGSTPFDWMIKVVPSSTATLDESEGRSMTVATSGGVAQAALRRHVLVEPGSYRLTYSVRGEPTSTELVGVRVNCPPDPRVIAESSRQPLGSRGWNRRSIEFRIGPDCPVASIGVGGLGGEAGVAQFDDFDIQRLAGSQGSAVAPTGLTR